MCWRPPQYTPAPVTLIFDLLILKVVSESPVTCATSVPILNFLGLSVLDLGPMYATDIRQDVRHHHRLMLRLGGWGHNNKLFKVSAKHSYFPQLHQSYTRKDQVMLKRCLTDHAFLTHSYLLNEEQAQTVTIVDVR